MVRYHAYRTLTGQWLHRDLPLREAQWQKTLNGPTTGSATVPEDVMTEVASDGARLFRDWGTTVVREDDNGLLSHAGIVQPQTQYEAQRGIINLVGASGFFKGTHYDQAKSWGPDPAKKIARPDPIVITRDLISYVQSRVDCNVGVTVTGATSSSVRIGDNEEPYRLQYWEQPDVGAEIDKLAQLTPFDYEDRVAWATGDKVALSMHLGLPRLGKTRTDLLFEQGVNLADPIPVTGREQTVNDVIGIGNGEGSTMVYSRATRRDGTLRRTVTITDKTASKAYMDKRVQAYLESRRGDIDIAQILVADHDYAPISAISVGDDINIKADLPSYGAFDVMLRVLSIGLADDQPHLATINTALSSSFSYIATEEISE